jgi:uncharacterized protein
VNRRLYRFVGTLPTLALALCVSGPPTLAAEPQLATESFKFPSAGAILAGTLVVPAQIVAAVVLVQGSGPTERMLGFANALAKQGIASLTYDKRGVGESGGVYVGRHNADPSNLQLLARDAACAVQELMRRLPSQHGPVGIIGFSQGGWIVPLAAKADPDIKFMVLWSGPLATTHEQLRFQDLTQQQPDFWDHHTEAQVRQSLSVTGDDHIPFGDTDPRDALKDLSIPGLWLFGGRDIYVPVTLSIERLRALMAQGKRFEFKLFPASGHDLDEKDAFPATIEWIKRTASQ